MKIALGTYTISSSIIGILFTQLIAFDTRSQVKAIKFSLSLFLALFCTLKLDKISPKRGRLTVISKNWQKVLYCPVWKCNFWNIKIILQIKNHCCCRLTEWNQFFFLPSNLLVENNYDSGNWDYLFGVPKNRAHQAPIFSKVWADDLASLLILFEENKSFLVSKSTQSYILHCDEKVVCIDVCIIDEYGPLFWAFYPPSYDMSEVFVVYLLRT